jgi:rhodanese-related sulfurtransferase
MNSRVIAGAGAVALAALAAFVGSPDPRGGSDASVRALASEIEHETDHVTALELAQWIRERRPGLRVLDVRIDSEFDAYHIPTAERVPLSSLAAARFEPRETLVLYSEGGAHAAQGWVLLRMRGHRNVYFLRGGILEWLDDIMNPAVTSELTRYFGGTSRRTTVPIPGSGTTVVARMRRRSC